MTRLEVKLPGDGGLHARPADLFVRAARSFRAHVAVSAGGRRADGKEILEVLLLGARRGEVLSLEVDGPDEVPCARVLAALALRAPGAERLERRRAQGHAWVAGSDVTEPAPDLSAAIARVRAELKAERTALAAAPELAGIPAAQSALLGEIERAIHAGQPLEAAGRGLEARLAAASSEETRGRAEDVAELCERVRRHLEGRSISLPPGGGPWIWVSRRLEASAVMLSRGRGVAGFMTTGLEPTSHAGILARGLGLPVASVAPEVLATVRTGARVEVEDVAAAAPPTAPSARKRPALVRANVSSLEEAVDAFALGAEGVGLVRTELLFAAARRAPDIEEQAVTYRALALPFGGQPVTYRLFDAGGDKHVPFLGTGDEPRGIARLRAFPDVLRSQVSAIELIADEARMRLLVPYVESAADLEGLTEHVVLGAMIESAAGAARAAQIARRAGFIGLGTNDLAASALGRPRASTEPTDVLRPEVRELIREVVAEAKDAGREVSVCGEAAAEPEAIGFFLEIGVDALSVSPLHFRRVVAHLEGG
jgi:phosphotransferase system HPr (HPr) family protein